MRLVQSKVIQQEFHTVLTLRRHFQNCLVRGNCPNIPFHNNKILPLAHGLVDQSRCDNSLCVIITWWKGAKVLGPGRYESFSMSGTIS